MNRIVAFIIKIRKLKGIKQSYMAKQLGISIRQYQRIESGDCGITIDTLESICDVLGMGIILVDKSLFKN